MNIRKKKELLKLVKQYKKSKGSGACRLTQGGDSINSLDWNYGSDGIHFLPGSNKPDNGNAIIKATAESNGYKFLAGLYPPEKINGKYAIIITEYRDWLDTPNIIIYKQVATFQESLVLWKKYTGIKVILKMI